MLISAEEINKVLTLSENKVTLAGKRYFEQNRVEIAGVKIISEQDYIVRAYVRGNHTYEVAVKKEKGKIKYLCECPYHTKTIQPCKHIIALVFDMYINENKYLEFEKKTESKVIDTDNLDIRTYRERIKDKAANDSIIHYYENLELLPMQEKGSVSLYPKLSLAFKGEALQVSFKIGKTKMYLLKNVYEFGQHMLQKEEVKYGKDLAFKHELSAFTKESQNIARFIAKKAIEYHEFASLGNYSFSINKSYRNMLMLKYGALDEFFSIMKDHRIPIEDYDNDLEITSIELVEKNPEFSFSVKDKGQEGLILIPDQQDYLILEGQDFHYVLYRDQLYRVSAAYSQKVIPLLLEIKNKKLEKLVIPEYSATSFCDYVYPNLRYLVDVAIDNQILDKYKAESLGTKVYLDIEDSGNIVAVVKFCYGEIEFNPFNKLEEVKCNRNILAETKAKELMKRCGFLVNEKKNIIYLTGDEEIYEFLNEGINLFMKKFEVLITDKLKNKQIINPKTVAMGVRIQNDLLKIDIEDLGISDEELRDILKSYRLKKKYYRLKDGSYINIDSSGIDTLASISDTLNISETDLVSGKVELPRYRAIYLDHILQQKDNITIEKDASYKEVVRDMRGAQELDFALPSDMENVLRPYQKTGFNWVKTIDKYHFGGILADDMGLGKTVQLISLFMDENQNGKKTSIVVCPSSLYINWEKEIHRFAPKLKTLVICGSAEKREEMIRQVEKYDVIITSYDLLKRDIEHYHNVSFRYIVADEAQYIKNNNTKNARALKKLKGSTRYALTGTPIENSLSELWSIFDYIMPGYLFSYKRFKEEFELPIIKEDDKEAMHKLQTLVAPFILRRVKKEVLKELPDKTETVMYNEMSPEQEKLYEAYLAKARKEIEVELDNNGFEKSRVKILSIITRLRQICCHPGLFIDNYTGESEKLNQCMEIIEDAISGGHKLLLFSQFTSMFEFMTEELKKRKINYSILTGKTKVDTRIETVDTFNDDKNISVFLISLKAGGTGLNLTGADMVIHYDPWWNLSAENQATDRAYRIGQRSNVQVFKLITSNSIEEKIQKLQERKMDLTNSIIKEGTTFINKMSKEEILALFDE